MYSGKKIVYVIIFLIFTSIVFANPLQISSNGQSSYVIVVSPQAGKIETFAAEELQKYLTKIIGTKLPIVNTSGENPFIAIGDNPATNSFHVPSRYPGDDAFRIISVNNNIILKGAHPRATLFAVYAFLEKLGCWWFSPSATYLQPYNEYVPQNQSLSVESIDIFERPFLKYRKKDSSVRGTCEKSYMVECLDWATKNRCNIFCVDIKKNACMADITEASQLRGIDIEYGGHDVPTYFLSPKKYFETHPEWFAMVDGKRAIEKYFAPSACFAPAMFETGNPQAVATLTANLVDFLKKYPEIKICRIWAPDAGTWSESPESQAIGTVPDRMRHWVNQVNKGIRKAGLTTRVSFIAYDATGSLKSPENLDYDKDVMLEFCLSQDYTKPSFDRSSELNAMLDSCLISWAQGYPGDISIYSYYSKYSWLSMPVALPRQISQDIKYWSKVGATGAALYGEPSSWLPLEINHLAFARASWDVCFDAEQWLTDYLKARYGPAAETMGRYYEIATEISLKGIIHASGQPLNLIPKIEKARELLAEASNLAEKTPRAKWLIDKISWQPSYQEKLIRLRYQARPSGDIELCNKFEQEIEGIIDSKGEDGSIFPFWAKFILSLEKGAWEKQISGNKVDKVTDKVDKAENKTE